MPKRKLGWVQHTEQVNIRLTPEEKAFLERLANGTGRSVSQVVRDCIHDVLTRAGVVSTMFLMRSPDA